jgi:hypothetical protein
MTRAIPAAWGNGGQADRPVEMQNPSRRLHSIVARGGPNSHRICGASNDVFPMGEMPVRTALPGERNISPARQHIEMTRYRPNQKKGRVPLL